MAHRTHTHTHTINIEINSMLSQPKQARTSKGQAQTIPSTHTTHLTVCRQRHGHVETTNVNQTRVGGCGGCANVSVCSINQSIDVQAKQSRHTATLLCAYTRTRAAETHRVFTMAPTTHTQRSLLADHHHSKPTVKDLKFDRVLTFAIECMAMVARALVVVFALAAARVVDGIGGGSTYTPNGTSFDPADFEAWAIAQSCAVCCLLLERFVLAPGHCQLLHHSTHQPTRHTLALSQWVALLRANRCALMGMSRVRQCAGDECTRVRNMHLPSQFHIHASHLMYTPRQYVLSCW
jgi:hypothetical protein